MFSERFHRDMFCWHVNEIWRDYAKKHGKEAAKKVDYFDII